MATRDEPVTLAESECINIGFFVTVMVASLRSERAERDDDAAAIVDFVETLEVIADHSKDSAGRARVVMQSNRTVIKAARERVK